MAGASYAYSFLGRWDEAVEEGQKALSLAQEFSDNSYISFSAWAISLAYTYKGDLARAMEYGKMAVDKAPTPADKVWAEVSLALARCRGGDRNKGIQVLTEIVPSFRTGRFAVGEIAFSVYLAEGYLLAAEYDKARQTALQCIEVAERCGVKYFLGWAHRLLGEIALKTDPDEAAPHFEKAMDIFREIRAENELALAYSGMGRLHKLQAGPEKAREYLTKALETFERLGTLIEPDKVRREFVELPP